MAIEIITVPNARFIRNEPYGSLFGWQRDWLGAFDAGQARFSILEIHRRARKTSTAINLLIRECDLHPKCRYVYVGPTFAEARRIIWDDPTMLREALPDQRVLSWKLNEQHMIVKFGNGSVLQCVGGDDPDNLRGIDAEGFVFDEWAQQKESCWTEVLQPIFRQSGSRWVAFLYCVSPDTMILSSDGWHEIRDFHDGSDGYSRCDHNLYGLGGFHQSEQFYRSGPVPTVQVRTRKGFELECTKVHRVWTPDGWRYASDLEVGSLVSIQYGQGVFGEQVGWDGFSYRAAHGVAKALPFVPDRDFYYFLGLFVGDGYASRCNTIITTNDEDIREFLRPYGFIRRDKWHMVFSGSALSRLLDWFGCRFRAPKKHVPAQILRAPRWAQIAFLKGLFDADGCSPRGRAVVSMCTTSAKLAKQTQLMLLNLGIISTRYQHKEPAVSQKACGRYRAWVVEMNSRFAVKFHDQIGFRVKRKASCRPQGRIDGESVRVEGTYLPANYFSGMNESGAKRQVNRGIIAYATIERLNKRKPAPYWEQLLAEDTTTDQIVSITSSVSEVMDFVIPETHSFVSNGFISHNTPKGNNFATRMFDRAACVDEGRALPTRGRAEHMRPGWYAARLVASESGVIPAAELEAARLEMPDSFYQQEFECARIAEEEMCLITSAMLDKLPRKMVVHPRTPRLISCDPSMGGDACVSHAFQASHVLEKIVRHTRDPIQIFGELVMLGDKHHAGTYVVDSIGIGQGICVPLRQAKKHVIEVCSSAGGSDPGRFQNFRASMWWDVMTACRKTEIEYPADAETRRQIPYATRYKVNSSGRIQIIEKQVIKQVLGRSPDDAESWGMGIAHIGQARTPDEIELLAIQEAVGADSQPDDDYPRLSLRGLGLYADAEPQGDDYPRLSLGGLGL